MGTMTPLLTTFALFAALASGAASAADPPKEAKPSLNQERSGFCLLNTQRCLDMAEQPAKFCRLSQPAPCSREGALVRVAPGKPTAGYALGAR
jgi:hypothetical protein